MPEQDRGTEQTYEEDIEFSVFWSWVVILVFSLSVLAYMLVVCFAVRETPRQWDFGLLPDTPAESIYSTARYTRTKEPSRQLSPLPEAEKRPTVGRGRQ
jgi:hypothetical protein